MKQIFASMELTGSNIRMVVAKIINQKLYILATKEVVTASVSHGRVLNSDMLTKDILNLRDEISLLTGFTINKTLLVLPPLSANYNLVEGHSTITNPEKIVYIEDLTRAMQASVYNQISEERELITILPIEFKVDDQKVKMPISKPGAKVSTKSIMVTARKEFIHPIVAAIDNAGIEVVDIGISSIADYYYKFNTEFDLRRGIIVNINDDLTSVSYYNKGVVVSSDVIKVGTDNVISDLAYVYNLNHLEATKLYERFAFATTRQANINEILTVYNKNKDEVSLNQYEVSEVVMARLTEILKLSKNTIQHLTTKEISYIYYAGSATETPGFNALLKEVVGTGIKVITVDDLGARNNKYLSVLGNIYYFKYKLQLKGKHYTMYNEGDKAELNTTKNNVFDKFLKVFNNEEE